MVSVARKNLFAEKIRFAISVSGVAFSVLLILILFGIYQGWRKQLTRYIESIPADIWILQKGSPDMFHSTSLLPLVLKDEIAKAEGVKSVKRYVGRQVMFTLNKEEVRTYLVGYDVSKDFAGPVSMVRGTKKIKGRQIIVDRVFAQQKNVEIGDTLKIVGKKFLIKGISEKGNVAIYQFSFIPLAEAEKLFGMENFANFFIIRKKDEVTVDTLKKNIEKKFPDVEVETREKFVNNNKKIIEETFLPILWVLVLVGLIIGIIIVGLMIYTATIEKSKEYGILKAIGASNLQLYKIILEQASISGLLGYAIGIGAFLIFSRLIVYPVPSFVTLITWVEYYRVFLFTIVMVLLSAYLPVRRIAHIDPADVFKA